MEPSASKLSQEHPPSSDHVQPVGQGNTRSTGTKTEGRNDVPGMDHAGAIPIQPSSLSTPISNEDIQNLTARKLSRLLKNAGFEEDEAETHMGPSKTKVNSGHQKGKQAFDDNYSSPDDSSASSSSSEESDEMSSDDESDSVSSYSYKTRKQRRKKGVRKVRRTRRDEKSPSRRRKSMTHGLLEAVVTS